MQWDDNKRKVLRRVLYVAGILLLLFLAFAIYAMHLPIAIIILKVLSICIPQNEWFEIPKFVIMIITTLVIINLVCAFLEKFAPKIYSTLMGNRISKK